MSYKGQEIKKLGFGFMRLPNTNGKTDMEQTKEMVDIFMNKGFTYFDTAYVYGDGQSELDLQEALVKRYPREKYQIADKLPIWAVNKKEDMETIFNTSLQRVGVDYFDYYLLHALSADKALKCEEMGAWEFAFEMKRQGKIKNVGFSFHDTAEVLDDILTKHPEAEFVQLQLNYYDWENNDVQSRACYEVALKHNKPIIIMEPVKGGTLANMTTDAEVMLKKADNNASIASWAVRYAASLENIVTVLSGMSNLEQLNDNVNTMADFKKLTKEEFDLLFNVVKVINEKPTIPCTDCKYCVKDCPMQINIPQIFKVMNHHKKFDADPKVVSNKWSFDNQTGEARPSSCIQCALCEGHCPQKINIIKELEEIAELYE